MRSDFSKVVTERPRHGSSKRYRAVRERGPIDEDAVGSIEGMRRPHSKDTKEFSDLLGPLHRFLHSRIGHKWDDVYSEICAHLKGRNTQQQHIIGHIWQYVERYVELGEDGQLRSKAVRFYRVDRNQIYSDFYIDPRDGILRKNHEWRHYWRWNRAPKQDENVRVIDDHRYERHGGIWFEVTVEKMTDSYRNQIGELVYYTKTIGKKRSLSGKELRQTGLTNE